MPSTLPQSQDIQPQKYRKILGLSFFIGDAKEAVKTMANGGLLVVPAAPALKDLPSSPQYHEALKNADLVIADSAFMVLSWNLLHSDKISRLSGLAYLRELLDSGILHQGRSFWIMASPDSAARNKAWLESKRIVIAEQDTYLAPMYQNTIEDRDLLERLKDRSPSHIVVTLGGGTQERLGLYLKRNLPGNPAIHCIGAAIAFLSGDQVHIPAWADRLYIGWLLRCISEPRRFIRRYWDARKLFPLILRYRERSPDTLAYSEESALIAMAAVAATNKSHNEAAIQAPAGSPVEK